MNKRLAVKLAVVVAALSAMTLLQGCGEDDGIEIGGAWAPIGSVPLAGFGAFSTSTAGQATTGSTGGAVSGGG